MAIEYFRISQQAKDQLTRLKRVTGIEHWNTLCRWAFCISIADPSVPSPVKLSAEGAVEMDWKTFGGSHQEVYYALLKHRCYRDGLGVGEDILTMHFRLHLHRGIGYLAAHKEIKSIAGLLKQSIVLQESLIAIKKQINI